MSEIRQPGGNDAPETLFEGVKEIARYLAIPVLGTVAIATTIIVGETTKKASKVPALTKLEEAYHYNKLDGLTQESFLRLEYLTPASSDLKQVY